MYERIMVPLDGSDRSEAALAYAEDIASKVGAELLLVSVSFSSRISHVFRSYLQTIGQQARGRLKDCGTGPEPEVHIKVLDGKAADEIVRCADESNVSLIVMSSRGLSGQGQGMLGSVAGKVVGAARKPVLLVRPSANSGVIQQKRPISRILAPLDGSKAGESAIPYTEALARALSAEVVALRVTRPLAGWLWSEGNAPYAIMQDDDEIKSIVVAYLENVADRLKAGGLRVSTAVCDGNPAEQVIEYARSNGIDLIAMSSHGRSGIGRWAFGSITTKVLQAGSTSVLIVRAVKG